MIQLSPLVQSRVDETYKDLSMLSKYNAELFMDYLETCKTENEVVHYLINIMPFYQVTGKEVDRLTLQKFVDSEEIIINEKFHRPDKSKDEKGRGMIPIKTAMSLILPIRRNQQVSFKEGKSAKDSSSRDVSGQVTSDSRSGALTDAELAVIIAHGGNAILKELMGPASADLKAKAEMKKQILATGTFSLNDLPDDPTGKKSLLKFHHYMRAMGFDTNVIEEPL